ncbi:hypothetical protein HUJ04_008188 [Dendroctonus ponderosae]|nr:hypothetical protein HUJ04_008188 [Dendroctonus ponderosae]
MTWNIIRGLEIFLNKHFNNTGTSGIIQFGNNMIIPGYNYLLHVIMKTSSGIFVEKSFNLTFDANDLLEDKTAFLGNLELTTGYAILSTLPIVVNANVTLCGDIPYYYASVDLLLTAPLEIQLPEIFLPFNYTTFNRGAPISIEPYILFPKLMEDYQVKKTRSNKTILAGKRGDSTIESQQRLNKKALNEQLRERTLNTWQHQWDTADTGRCTHQWLPDIYCRQSINLICNKRTVQLLTGHGQFRTHYKRIGKSSSSDCENCSTTTPDEPILRIFECDKYNALRRDLNTLIGDQLEAWRLQRSTETARRRLPDLGAESTEDNLLMLGPGRLLEFLMDTGNSDFLAEFVRH